MYTGQDIKDIKQFINWSTIWANLKVNAEQENCGNTEKEAFERFQTLTDYIVRLEKGETE